MLKNKLNYKLVNLALIVLIVFLLYQTGNLWIGVLSKFLHIILPFLFGFVIAYAIHPFLKKLEEIKLPKWLGISIIVIITFFILFSLGYLITTVMFGQLSNLFSSIMKFINSLKQTSLDFDFSILENSLTDIFNKILSKFGTYVSDNTINLIDSSISFLSVIFISFASFIYFLVDMDKIRYETKSFFKKKSQKTYYYIKTLDIEMKNYLSGFLEIIIITLVEYTLMYTVVGHPNAILLGFLSAISNLIPYFGGIIVNIIAIITSFVVSPVLLIKTIIISVILSLVDSYVINPTVYGKSNSIHPIITLISLFAGGILFGILGVFVSFPLAIILVATYKYYKEDITRNIRKVTK